MRFHTRKWVKPEDLNANGTLFGGKLLAWIDEEAALYSIVQLENPKVVTKFMSEINFMSAAKQGDIVEIGLDVAHFGKSSLVLKIQGHFFHSYSPCQCLYVHDNCYEYPLYEEISH